MMMEDQLKDITGYLAKNGFQCHIVTSNAFLVDIEIEGDEQKIRCEIPKEFPYRFPEIILLKAFYDRTAPWPHVDKDLKLCIFDSNVSIPNIDKPYELVLFTIQKAIELIENSKKGVNRRDFIDEFEQYWLIDSDHYITAISLENFVSKEVYFYKHSNIFYIATTKKVITNFFHKVKNLNILEHKIQEAFILQLEDEIYPPFPTNFNEALALIDRVGMKTAYLKYLKNDINNDKMVIFYIRDNMYGWYQTALLKQKGFRKANKLSEELLKTLYSKENIKRFSINYLVHQRIVTRSGDGNVRPMQTVSIIGCGSIGSSLAMQLAKGGIRGFNLIDPERISIDNIGRHLCGAKDIGRSKAEAVGERIVQHFPYIDCNSYHDTVNVNNEDYVFNDSYFCIMAIGNTSTELLLDKDFQAHSFKGCRIYVWVEPFMVGGHAIIINNPERSLREFFDSELMFKDKVLIKPELYTRRDLGCQTTYVPYAGLLVEMFTNRLATLILSEDKIIDSKHDYVYTFIGDIQWARRNNMDISDKWLSSKKFSDKLRRK